MCLRYLSKVQCCNWVFLFLFIIPVLGEKEGSNNMSGKLLSVDFEVFGIVQGVFFRKVRQLLPCVKTTMYTQKEAQNLGLRGFCKNTMQDTVVGTIQGEIDNINKMKNWLQKTGSPSSRIDKAEFKNEQEIKEYTFEDFSIRG